MMAGRGLAEDVGRRFDHVLVDEYQDTNALQAAILLGAQAGRAGAHRGRRRCAVDLRLSRRDRAQHPRFPEQLRAARRGDHARAELPLDRADPRRRQRGHEPRPRRLQQEPVLGAALAAEALAGRRSRTIAPRSTTSAEAILANREAGILLREQAVLFRTSHHSSQLELELRRRNIPYVKFGGLKFLELAHVKDLLALLRWAENPRDRIAAFRFLQLLPGIGPGTARKVLGCLEAAAHRLRGARGLRAAARGQPSSGRQLVGLLQDLAAREIWAGQLELARALLRSAARGALRLRPRAPADLDELVRLAATYRSRQQFLTELTLDPPAATGDEAGAPLLDEDYLILSTIHSAKGREWRAVYVLRVVDGCIPSDMATGSPAEIEEERRLLYVAMTRAQRPAPPDPPAPLLHHQPEPLRRPLRHRAAHALHPAGAAAPLRPRHLDAAGRGAGARRRAGCRGSTSRPRCARCGPELQDAFCPRIQPSTRRITGSSGSPEARSPSTTCSMPTSPTTASKRSSPSARVPKPSSISGLRRHSMSTEPAQLRQQGLGGPAACVLAALAAVPPQRRRQPEMAVDLGRVGLGDREAVARQQLLEAALERPEPEIQAVPQRRRQQVAPAGDRRLADLAAAERPEQRAGGAAVGERRSQRRSRSATPSRPSPSSSCRRRRPPGRCG